MSRRILGIELRRSAAAWAALSTLPLLFSFAGVGGGMSGLMGEQRGTLVILVPLALGLGAWQARRDRRSHTRELVATTARPTWQRLLHTAAALGIGALTGYLVSFAAVSVYATIVGAHYPGFIMLIAVVAALSLAAALWLGMAAGRLVPWVLGPPLIAVAGFAAIVALSIVTDTEGFAGRIPPASILLDPFTTAGLDAFETLTTAARYAQLWWMVGIAAACLILCVATRWALLASAVPIAIGLAAVTALLPSLLWDAITLDESALALVCTPDDEVCVRRLHPDLLEDLEQPGREALAILSAKLPDPPTAVVEAYFGNDTPVTVEPRADTLYAEVFIDRSGRTELSEDDILWTLLMGAGTLPCDPGVEATPDRYFAARLVAAAWLLERPPLAPTDTGEWAGLPPTSLTHPAHEALLALPPDEQQARVASLREAELACDPGDRLEILVGS